MGEKRKYSKKKKSSSIVLYVLLIIIIISTLSYFIIFNKKEIKSSFEKTVLDHTKTILSFDTRVPGEIGNKKTREYISNELEKYGFSVTYDTFSQDTIIGKKVFTNIIATYKPRGKRRYIFSAHYDSKLFENFKFLGATDSVVSCAMLLDFAKYINTLNLNSFDYEYILFNI